MSDDEGEKLTIRGGKVRLTQTPKTAQPPAVNDVSERDKLSEPGKNAESGLVESVNILQKMVAKQQDLIEKLMSSRAEFEAKYSVRSASAGSAGASAGEAMKPQAVTAKVEKVEVAPEKPKICRNPWADF